ncbi:hypothetical protein PENSUB_13384 [Penicillium subrubescens]|uniref:Alcohol dehydrogenase-like C-terminal domain-containing protein n=1 Tax=Penicillium subrubescens TaxID=1316194 RepID=A0A1Q5SRN3_9EURO|nr:hypothetical protein PENSUB_13384 [Penicillium subrubescens]
MPGELLIQVKGSTVYKDNLEWKELYLPGHVTLGNDISGTALLRYVELDTTIQNNKKRVLIIGAGGGIGMLLVQFAELAGHQVVEASSSNERKESFQRSIGANEVVECRQSGIVGFASYDPFHTGHWKQRHHDSRIDMLDCIRNCDGDTRSVRNYAKLPSTTNTRRFVETIAIYGRSVGQA